MPATPLTMSRLSVEATPPRGRSNHGFSSWPNFWASSNTLLWRRPYRLDGQAYQTNAGSIRILSSGNQEATNESPAAMPPSFSNRNDGRQSAGRSEFAIPWLGAAATKRQILDKGHRGGRRVGCPWASIEFTLKKFSSRSSTMLLFSGWINCLK